MHECLSSHLRREKSLRNLGMTRSGTTLLPLAFRLDGTRHQRVRRRGHAKLRTIVFRFNAGAPPSKTNTGRMP